MRTGQVRTPGMCIRPALPLCTWPPSPAHPLTHLPSAAAAACSLSAAAAGRRQLRPEGLAVRHLHLDARQDEAAGAAARHVGVRARRQDLPAEWGVGVRVRVGVCCVVCEGRGAL